MNPRSTKWIPPKYCNSAIRCCRWRGWAIPEWSYRNSRRQVLRPGHNFWGAQAGVDCGCPRRRRGTGHQSIGRPDSSHGPGQRRFDSRRWPRRAHHEPAGSNGAIHSRRHQCRPFRHAVERNQRHRGASMTAQPVRVLVVDDSALMRKLIPQILETDNSIQVVGTAMDGNFGLKKIEDLKPQVITLDLEMPGMGGLDMLKEIMRRHRIPVIVVSSHTTLGASVTLKALSLGAFDFVAKPSDVSSRMQEIAQELLSKIKAAAQSRGISVRPEPEIPMPGIRTKGKATLSKQPPKLVAIGLSTGCRQSLHYML